MNTTGSQATGALVHNPPIRRAVFAAFDRRTDAMSLLRSICCMFGSRSRSQRRCDVKHLVILVRGRPSEKEPAKTNFDAWRAAQLAPLD